MRCLEAARQLVALATIKFRLRVKHDIDNRCHVSLLTMHFSPLLVWFSLSRLPHCRAEPLYYPRVFSTSNRVSVAMGNPILIPLMKFVALITSAHLWRCQALQRLHLNPRSVCYSIPIL